MEMILVDMRATFILYTTEAKIISTSISTPQQMEASLIFEGILMARKTLKIVFLILHAKQF
jgi:hypothetical protein